MIFILNFDLIKNVLIIGMSAGIITTSLMQKLKTFCSDSSLVPILCFFISMIVGTLFALAFSDISILYALWAGLFAFIGADALYVTFEGKIFKPLEDLIKKDIKNINREDNDESI